jgi:hypothetical protein
MMTRDHEGILVGAVVVLVCLLALAVLQDTAGAVYGQIDQILKGAGR